MRVGVLLPLLESLFCPIAGRAGIARHAGVRRAGESDFLPNSTDFLPSVRGLVARCAYRSAYLLASCAASPCPSSRCAYRNAYLLASCAAHRLAALGKQNFNLHVVTGGRAVP